MSLTNAQYDQILHQYEMKQLHNRREAERKLGPEAEAFAITCPLITKADGTKFGKTESGNVWLDPRYTSPYKFYQFWLNVSDEDAKRYIKIFTLLDRETIEALIAEHEAAPHLRVLQKRLAQEITTMIHSREEYEKAVEASAILFGDDQIVIFLSALHEEVFAGYEVGFLDGAVELGELFLIEAHAAALHELAHLALTCKHWSCLGEDFHCWLTKLVG